MDGFFNSKVSFFRNSIWENDLLEGSNKLSDFEPLFLERFYGQRLRRDFDTHNDYWEITAVIEGDMIFYADRKIPVTTNSVILVPPGLGHKEYAVREADTFWLGFKTDRELCDKSNALTLKSDNILKKMHDFWLFSVRSNSCIGIELEGMLLSILGCFFRKLKEGSSGVNTVFEEAMKYMNENFSEDIIVADLADRFNLSEGYFYRQ
ncbi:MAG: cupin domain-containing protein, partial [Planctomycetota bacterium]